MAYRGKVCLIKRNKLYHVGIATWLEGRKYMYSPCNCTWDIKDKVSKGDYTEVTCKRCIKLLERAEEDGTLKI